MDFRHILVPVDLSPESKRAFPPAAALARAGKARVTLLHVVPDALITPHGAPFAPPMGELGTAKQSDAARAELEALRPELKGAVSVDAQVLVAQDPAQAIARYAQEHGCDLIVASTHGRTGFRRFMLGSVAEAMLRHSTVPVLCIPRPA